MAGFGAWAGGFVFAGMLAIFALVLIFAQQLENWLLVRKLKATPQIYGEVVILLSNEDYFAQSNAQETRLNWSVFTRALHFEDGFLLFQGPRLYHWLPFAALVNPSQIAELESLLRSKIFDYSDHRKKNSRTLSNGGKV
ncbi:MAG: YcxB family protein [Planctomycetales bacterium]|nr:YcxB family protein [Planctomycetales bacterium]